MTFVAPNHRGMLLLLHDRPTTRLLTNERYLQRSEKTGHMMTFWWLSSARTLSYAYAATPNSASNLAHTLSSTGVAAARMFASSCAAFKLPIGLP